MTLLEQLEAAFKTALKNQDRVRISTLRLAKAALKIKEKELRREPDDAEVIAVISVLIKRGRDAMDQFRQGGREDLYQKEEAEVAILQSFLPSQLSQEELQDLLQQTIAELKPSGPRDMGRVMKEMMARAGGRADGKLVSEMVKAKLSSL
jgi:uncharacterized protein YqeY